MPWKDHSEVNRRVIWKDHSNDPHDGLHAFLAPSNGAWEGMTTRRQSIDWSVLRQKTQAQSYTNLHVSGFGSA